MSLDYCRILYESNTTLHFFKILCVFFVRLSFIIFLRCPTSIVSVSSMQILIFLNLFKI